MCTSNCTHGSARGHAIPGTHHRTQSPTTPLRKKTQSPLNTHTHTHTLRARSQRTPVHTPVLPAAPQPAPFLPAPSQDAIRRLPKPKFRATGAGAGAGRYEGRARRGRKGCLGTRASVRPQPPRRPCAHLLAERQKEAGSEGESEVEVPASPPIRQSAVCSRRGPPARQGKEGTRRRGPEAGRPAGVGAQVSCGPAPASTTPQFSPRPSTHSGHAPVPNHAPLMALQLPASALPTPAPRYSLAHALPG